MNVRITVFFSRIRKRKSGNVENIFILIRRNGYQKFAGMKGRRSALKPSPRAEADDESKNWYLAKLTRVQCRLRMQKMVELSGSLGGGRKTSPSCARKRG